MPNEVNVNRWSTTIKDYSGETTTSAFNILALTNNAAFVAAETAFEAALNALILGVQQNAIASLQNLITSSPAASPNAQREIKMLARFTDDTTGKSYSVSFGTLDLANAGLVAGTDFINLESPSLGADFKAAFEAFAASPDGNTVTLNSLQFVGRNS